MIFIVVKFKVKPDWSERWLGLVNDFTQATRQAQPCQESRLRTISAVRTMMRRVLDH